MRVIFVFAAVCCMVASANVQSGVRVSSVARIEKAVQAKQVVVTAAAVKGKAAAPVSTGFFSKDVQDKLQLAALFAVWYAFNAGCKFFLSFFLLFHNAILELHDVLTTTTTITNNNNNNQQTMCTTRL